MRYIYFILMVFSLFSWSACIQEIDFETERLGEIIVIDGRITDGQEAPFVRVRETTFNPRVTAAVTNASVRILDDVGSIIYLEEVDFGYYSSFDLISAVPGRTYWVEVQLENGRMYQSEPNTMPEATMTVDSIHYDFGERTFVTSGGIVRSEDVINIYADASKISTAEEDFFLRWDVEEVYKFSPTDFPDPFGMIPPPCYVSQFPNSQDIKLFNGANFSGTRISTQQIATQLVDHTFLERHYFNVNLRTINQDAFIYFSQLDATLSNVGSIFDTPPSGVVGNVFNPNDLTEEVLGYFEASAVQVKRIFLLPGDIPFLIDKYCEYNPQKPYWDYEPECFDCLSAKNSTLERPFYFP